MKYEWRKQERDFYQVKQLPTLLNLPATQYITINGKGNPNHEDFSQRVGVLYSLAYQIKSLYKQSCKNNHDLLYDDFSVFPLEGMWTSTTHDPLAKDEFIYTIMIKQPSFITSAIFTQAYTCVQDKKPHPLLSEVAFEKHPERKVVQILHIGSFDEEPLSFAKLDVFAKEHALQRCSAYHHEIYVAGARALTPSKKKTILRYDVTSIG